MNLQTIETQPQIVLPLTREKSSQGFLEGVQNFVVQYLDEYEVRDVERVTDFLFRNSFLIDILLEIPAQVRRVFGEDQKLILSFWLDPEDPTWHHVQVLISTKCEAEKSFDLMDKFDEEWWLDNCQRVESKLSISKEY